MIYNDGENQVPTFTITEAILYVPVVTLSTQDNAKLIPQLKSGFRRTISWISIKSIIIRTRSKFKSLKLEPSFQGVNRLFALAFEDDVQRTSSKIYYLPNVEIKDYNVMIDGKKLFWSTSKKW